MKILVASVLLLSGLASWTHAQTALTYQKPPHMLWEMNRWLDTYLKPAAPAVR
jgi:hypothetical protein